MYDLARQMLERGLLNCLYTAFPKSRVKQIHPQKIQSFPWLMVPTLAYVKAGGSRFSNTLNWWTLQTFTRWLASNLENCNVFHHLSGCGGAAQQVAHDRFGALVVCDRGSSHIVAQNDILAEEFGRWGLPYKPIPHLEWETDEYERADLIVVPSSFAYRSFVEKGITEHKLARVSFGVDLGMFKQMKKQDSVFRVIYVGSMSLRKGVHYLLEAFAGLNLPGAELWLIGAMTDEIRPFFRKYSGIFRYFGVIPRAELNKYYSQSSVFVIASVEEGLALVQGQAMACGLPVIATTNTGAEDLFTNDIEGFIVPIRNPEAIRERVMQLYEDHELRDEMSQAALRRVKMLGGWVAYGEKMVELYQDYLRKRC